jgi:cell wall-associated NlpC family hydrolase
VRKYIPFIIAFLLLLLPLSSQAAQVQSQSAALSGMVVPAEDLEGLVPPETLASKNESIAVSRSAAGYDSQKLLQTAMSLLGKKYSYGGSGPDTFDCSGFTMYVYGTAGYDLPHSAAEQAAHGIEVDKDNLRPGDLVFFSYYNEPGINHVGIYTGDNCFIHASSSENNNKTVTISRLDSPYYESNYKGARRLLR